VLSLAPFARQLFVDKDVRNERLVGALGESATTSPEALVRKTCAHLARTSFGRGGESNVRF